MGRVSHTFSTPPGKDSSPDNHSLMTCLFKVKPSDISDEVCDSVHCFLCTLI